MNQIRKGFPFCAGCGRKEKRQGLNADEYFCIIVADTPMKGIVTGEVDGTECVEHGFYIPIVQKENT